MKHSGIEAELYVHVCGFVTVLGVLIRKATVEELTSDGSYFTKRPVRVCVILLIINRCMVMLLVYIDNSIKHAVNFI